MSSRLLFRLFSSLFALAATLTPQATVAQDMKRDEEHACRIILESVDDLGVVATEYSSNGIHIAYEDRSSRQPLRTALRVQEEVNQHAGGCYAASVSAFRFGTRVGLRTSNVDAIQKSPASGLQADLEIQILHDYEVDFFQDWFRDRIAIAPKIKVWHPSGVMLTAQYAFPLRNQVPLQSAAYWDDPYPNVLSLGMRKRVGNNLIGAISGGLFERNRYGGDAQVYWISSRVPVVVGARLSATGYWSYQHGTWSSTSIDQLAGFLDVTTYLPWYNLRARGRIGHFLQPSESMFRPGERLIGQSGASGELSRIFGEMELGFYGFYNGTNLFPGFRFSFPLSPRKGVTRGRFAAYATRRADYPWDLGRVVRGQNTGEDIPKRGELYRTELDVWENLRWLTPWASDSFD